MIRSAVLAVAGAMCLTKLIAAGAGEDGPGGEPDLIQKANLSGSARLGYWTSSRRLDNQENLGVGALWLRAAPDIGSTSRLVVDGRESHERLLRGGETKGVLREGYFQFRTDAADLQVGKQIIVWGRADQINPTDNLSPRDFTLLMPEDADQRSGAVGARASYYFTDFSLTAVWLSDFKPNVLPLPPATSVLTYREHMPEDTHRQWAVKIERSGHGVDWSLSYFSGFDLNPDLSLDSATLAGLTVGLNYHRVRILGGDAATTLGRYGLRAEAAYTSTEDASGTDPEIKNPFFYAVLGIDRTFLQSFNVNLQYFVRVVSHYHDPAEIADPLVRSVAIQQAVLNNQFDSTQRGMTLRFSNKWFNDTLAGEVAGIGTFSRHGYLIRPKLTYAFTDRWKGTLGADIFRGGANSFFGSLRNNSTAYIELQYGF